MKIEMNLFYKYEYKIKIKFFGNIKLNFNLESRT